MKAHNRFSISALLLTSFVVSAAPPRRPAIAADAIEQTFARLAGSILVNGRSMDYL